METPDGFDRDVWSQMATQLGLQGLVIPEEYGGSGYGYEELAVVFEEMGRALLCAPFFSTVALAVSALIASGDGAAMAAPSPRRGTGRSAEPSPSLSTGRPPTSCWSSLKAVPG